MSISKKIKTNDYKIEQNKSQDDLDIENAKISALSSGHVSKYDFLTGEDVLPEKDLKNKRSRDKLNLVSFYKYNNAK